MADPIDPSNIDPKQLEALKKLIDGLNNSLANLNKNYKALIKQTSDLSTEISSNVISQKAINEEREKANTLLRDQVSLSEEELIKATSTVEALNNKKELLNEIRNNLISQKDLILEKIKLDKDNGESYKQELSFINEKLAKNKEEFGITNKQNQSAIQNMQVLGAADDVYESIIGKLGITSDKSQTWLGKLEQVASVEGGISSAFDYIGKKISGTIAPSNLFANSVTAVYQATLKTAAEMDQEFAAFHKATGAAKEYREVIEEVRFGSLGAGVGLKESTQAVQELYMGMNQFSQMSKTAQDETARTVAVFDRLGISAGVSAQNLNLSTKALGMTVEESIHAQKEVYNTAKQLGVSPATMANEFAQSLPRLTQYGKESIKIFKDLATQSKATGLSMNELLGITQQFDTFSGAAEAAGKLNALLGGPMINSVELLNASEEERVKLLRDSIDLSGRNWNEMSKFEKMAVANAAGISDMAQANKLFGATASEFNKTAAAAEASAVSEKKLAESAALATSATEKLTKIMESLTIAAKPLLEATVWILDGILAVIDFLGNMTGPALIAVTGLMYLFTKSLWTAGAAQVAGEVATIAYTKSTLAGALASKIAGFAVGVYNGIVAASEGILTAIISAKKILVGWINLEAITTWAVTAAMTIYNTVAWLATVITEGLATAFLILTSPIGLVVLGIAAIIAAVVLLIVYFEDIDQWINNLTGGFVSLTDILFTVLNPINLLTLAGKVLYQNWETIVTGIKGMFIGLANTVREVFDTIFNFIKAPFNVYIKAANLVTGKINDVTGMSIPQIPMLASGATNFGGGMAIVGEKGPELVSLPSGSNVVSNENSTRLADAGAAVQMAKTEATLKQTEMIQKTIEKNNTVSKENQEQKTIILELDSRELGKFVLNSIEKNMKLSLIGVK